MRCRATRAWRRSLASPEDASPASSGSHSVLMPWPTANRSQLFSTASADRRKLHVRVLADRFPRSNLRWIQEADQRSTHLSGVNGATKDNVLIRQSTGRLKFLADLHHVFQERKDGFLNFCTFTSRRHETSRKLCREGNEPAIWWRDVLSQIQGSVPACLQKDVELRPLDRLPR